MRRYTLVVFALALLVGRRLRSQPRAPRARLREASSTRPAPWCPARRSRSRTLRPAALRELVADADGRFSAPGLPVGRYDVTAALAGFATRRRQDLQVQVGQTLTLQLELGVAGVAEASTVTAGTPVVESTRSQVSSVVDSVAIANLPVNGRNFIDFVLLTPGVTRDVRGGDISFAGQRGTLNSLVVDGADNNNTFFGQALGRTGTGRAPYQFSQDAVQEFQVNTNAYSAEYGRAGGAVINVVTKSGTNQPQGLGIRVLTRQGAQRQHGINEAAGRAKGRVSLQPVRRRRRRADRSQSAFLSSSTTTVSATASRMTSF